MEANAIWERKIEAEIRSLYFADLTTRFTLRKQIITGLAFFLSTASAATVIGKFPWYVPVALSAVVALATGYSIATGLDRRISTLSKLHTEWNSLWGEYDRLWNRWYDDETDAEMAGLIKRGREASLLATTDAPYYEDLMNRWSEHVYKSYLPSQGSAVTA